MVNTEYTNAWIDRYLRNELTAEDETRFETALLESPQLQADLEAAMALRHLLVVEEDAMTRNAGAGSESGAFVGTVVGPLSGPEESDTETDAGATMISTPWMPMALTGSLILVVLSGVMYWNVSHEMATLRTGIETLSHTHGPEIVVPLDIMRSAGMDIPEAIIHKPENGSFIVLDIELTDAAIAADRLHMALTDTAGDELAAWVAERDADGRSRASFDPEFLPTGVVWLEMRDNAGGLMDRRLLEFR